MPPHGGRPPRCNPVGPRYHVSIRAPARGATTTRGWRGFRFNGFYPRPRTGGDLPCRANGRPHRAFLSAPPHGGRHQPVEQRGAFVMFLSAPPHGGRPRFRQAWQPRQARFYPRPRTGGDAGCSAPSVSVGSFLSAPPHGGRHELKAVDPESIFVSIRAPARGATPRRSTRRGPPAGFYPRPRTGGDPAHQPDACSALAVSIRAPARGATFNHGGGPSPH